MSRAFGHDLLEGHGDFEIDGDPFFTINAGWNIGSGVASFDSASQAQLVKSGILIVGKMYEVRYTVGAVTGAGVRILIGSIGVGPTRTTTGNFMDVIVCVGSSSFFIQGLAGATATVDNVTVREAREYNRISVASSRGLRI